MAIAVLWLAIAQAEAAEVAAKVQFVVGEVSATSPDGKRRQLSKGDRVFSGETLATGPEGSAQLIYRDRSRMAIRVDTVVKIEEYHYDSKNESSSRSIFSLLGGALRSITGLIGNANKNNVTVKTSIATIGIRGTDHEVIHITPQLNGGKTIAEVGTYNRVYAGETIMQTAQGNLSLGINQVGFVGGTIGKVLNPVRLKELPKSIEREIVSKIPVQAKIKKIKPGPAGSTKATTSKSGSTRLNTGSTTSPLLRLEPTTTTITNKIDSSLTPATTTTISPTKTLEPILNLEPTTSSLKTLIPSTETSTTLLPKTTTIKPTLTIEPILTIEPTTIIAPKTITSPTTLIAPKTIQK